VVNPRNGDELALERRQRVLVVARAEPVRQRTAQARLEERHALGPRAALVVAQ